MAKIVLKNVKKQYGKKDAAAMEDVSLVVGEGEFLVLLGPSGCGKTTLLRILAGLEDPTAGEIWFDDRLVNEEPPDLRSVGMVFQNYALYPHMTVFENMAFGLRARGVPKQVIKQTVHDMVALLGLEGVTDHRPKQLSGGQRQRVALGRALVRDPELFLMDEPLSNLDANLREQMRMELARIHGQLKVTTVYVTHDQSEALTLADRIVVMNGGHVKQVGTPGEIYTSPADTFVAGFVGSPGMNLWKLEWEETEDGISLGDGALLLPRSFLPVLATLPRTVIVGIRPEHLELSFGKTDVKVVCRAEFFENLGSHTQLHAGLVTSGADYVNTDSPRLVARLDSDAFIDAGERVTLTAPASAINLFDAETGIRVQTDGASYFDQTDRWALT